MSRAGDDRTVDKIIGDILDAASAAEEIVGQGEHAWYSDRLLRLAAEAVINRIGDAAGRLPDAIRSAMPAVPWDDIRANRVLVAHIYHRIDPSILWATLFQDVPQLASELERWRSFQQTRALSPQVGSSGSHGCTSYVRPV
jgi:uncharacterized protein with HEPN domain